MAVYACSDEGVEALNGLLKDFAKPLIVRQKDCPHLICDIFQVAVGDIVELKPHLLRHKRREDIYQKCLRRFSVVFKLD